MLRPIRTIRNIPRLKDISFTLVKHGLHQLAGYLGAPLRVRLRSLLPNFARQRLSQAEQLRLAFQELGLIFIKLGQIVANRPDLFPAAIVDEFLKLQDRVEPLPFADIRCVIERELGGPICDFFREVDEECLAAASVAQVHRAVTSDGASVILKVQKPGLRRIMDRDLEILEFVASALSRMQGLAALDAPALIAEVRRMLERELNFNFERNAIDRVRANFAEDEKVLIPLTYPRLSTKRLLVLEFLDGAPLSRVAKDQLDPLEARRIARECSSALFQMIFRDGYFHGDPHGSNIMLLEDGRIGWVDFGSMGLLTEELRTRMVRLLRALLSRDYRRLAREVLRFGRPRREISMFDFSQDLAMRIDPYFGLTLRETDIPALFTTLLDLAREYEVTISPSFIAMTRALMLMETLTCRLDPDFDTVSELEPLVRRHLLDRYRPDRIASELLDELGELANTLWEYPRLIGEVLRQASEGRFHVEYELGGLSDLRRAFEGAGHNTVLALIVSALLVSSSLITAFDIGPKWWNLPVVGIVGYAFAGLLSLRIAFSSWRQ